MPICPICGKQLVRLASHLRKVHNLFYNTTQPTTLKEFIRLLKLIPLKPADWECLRKHRNQLSEFYESNKTLPPKVFRILYMSFDRYRSQKGPQLIIKDGLFPALKEQGKRKPKEHKPIIPTGYDSKFVSETEPMESKSSTA